MTSHSFRLQLTSEAQTEKIGQTLAPLLSRNQVIGLVGPLGAGKTRLSRAIAVSLGVEPSAISSPTFVLIQEYEGRLPVFHFDAYRLGSSEAFEALGVSEYWEAGGICLVEWADLVLECLPVSAWIIHLEPTGLDSRELILEGPGVERVWESLKRAITDV